MATRVVEGKKPYTGGEAIDIDQNKVISLKLRDENNLIIYDSGDDEIYVDLQLPDGITPTDAFPVGVTTGRAVVADGWDLAGTIICAKTTSGDNIKLLYADDGTLWIDNGTGTFKQIYFKADVDALLLALRNYIDGELAKKQNGVASATAPSNPSEGDLWYDTTNSAMKVWDGTAWQSVGTGGGSDIEYVTQAEYNALPSSKLTDGKHYFIYSTSGGGGWQPGANTVVYYPLDSTNTVNDLSGNSNTLTNQGATFGTYGGVDCANTTGYSLYGPITNLPTGNSARTISIRCNAQSLSSWMVAFGYGANASRARCALYYITDPGFALSHYTPDIFAYMPVSADTWYSIIYTYDGTTATLYINGTSVGTESASLSTASSDLVISGWGVGNETWSGYLSNFIMENVAWTSQEISDYYDQTKGDYGIS